MRKFKDNHNHLYLISFISQIDIDNTVFKFKDYSYGSFTYGII